MSQTISSFIEKLERLGTGSFIGEVRREVSYGGLRLINAGYRDSMDPYGNRWQPLTYRKGKPLVLTGAFRDTWMAYPTPIGVRFLSGVDYGAYHQYGAEYRVVVKGVKVGTRKLAPRMVIPSKTGGLPRTWTDMINKTYSSCLRKAVA